MNKPLTQSVTDRIAYQKPQPKYMRPDMVIPDAMGQNDPRLWVPLSNHVAVRPLQFNVTLGQYTHVLRVTKAGMIARHRHSGGVHAWVFKG
ncbi:MAG: cupin domain-containing protein, partial [Burkholderiales bacterium]